MTTRYKLSEQILRLYSGGDPSVATVKIEEVEELVNQVINSLLKTDILNVNMPSGETIPAGYVIAIYENIKVEKWQKRSRAKIPVTPVALPKDIGMYHVGPAGDISEFYIPIPPGYHALIKTDAILNNLNGRVGYTRSDNFVYFTKDITSPSGDVFVDMHVVCMDISKYSKYEPLPIPADMEGAVVEKVLGLLSARGVQTNLVDSTNQNKVK